MSSESQGVDYAAVLADLEARKAQIEAAIAVIKPLVALGLPPLVAPVMGPPTPSLNGGNGGTTPSIESDTFFGLGILDATRKFLGIRKRPASAPEIAEALRAGGQVNATASETFGNTLGATLSRSEAANGPVVRIGRGKYGLREWYANKPRVDAD